MSKNTPYEDLDDIYQAKSLTVGALFSETGTDQWGLRIPNYQREYKWTIQQEISRLIESIYLGFSGLFENQNKRIFLGSIIFAEQKKGPGILYIPVDIVDGQQRITTLFIKMVVMIVKLSQLDDEVDNIDGLSPDEIQWLKDELWRTIEKIQRNLIIKQEVRGVTSLLPRLIRDNDKLGTDRKESEFTSIISKYVFSLIQSGVTNYKDFKFPASLKTLPQGTSFEEIHNYFDTFFDKLALQPDEIPHLELRTIPVKNLDRQPYFNLFEVTPTAQKVTQKAEKNNKIEKLLKTILYSNYTLKRCGFATVKASNNEAAFDIFDSLNTTGLPLTAIETLVPEVVSHYDKHQSEKYAGSQSDICFENIQERFEKYQPSAGEQEKETKQIVVATALFIEGEKLSEKLSTQRSELRRMQASAIKKGRPDELAETINEIAEYRVTYFRKDGISNANRLSGLDGKTNSILKFTAYVFFESGTSLVLPYLARYFLIGKNSSPQNFEEFLECSKSLAAFLILRRAATGGTEKIPEIFRSTMNKCEIISDYDYRRPPGSILNLKTELIANLRSKSLNFDLENKSDWVRHVSERPSYSDTPSTIIKSLLYLSHHNTGPDKDVQGLLSRASYSPDPNRNFIQHSVWENEAYKEIEHIAPQSDQSTGWDGRIYDNSQARHCIGNLTLVPRKFNTILSNTNWKAKSEFYAALSQSDQAKRETGLNRAEAKGLKISASEKKKLIHYETSNILTNLSDVPDWNRSFVEKRSQRLLELAWDELYSWLKV